MKNKPSPYCPHGPTLLFERFYKSHKTSRRFFACSACRDRKDCSFFQWADEDVSDDKLRMRQQINLSLQPNILPRKQLAQRLVELKAAKEDIQRNYCHNCELLLFLSEITDHDKHDVTRGIDASRLDRPTTILKPLIRNKTNAQYLFSDKTCNFFHNLLNELAIDYVICIGLPRIHEFLQLQRSPGGKESIQSILLDIDHRYAQFYPNWSYCRYNMFNNYFFDGETSQQIYVDFMQKNENKKGIILIDPPFGGLLQVIAESLQKLLRLGLREEMPTILVFPYFLENHVYQCLRGFHMSDYKVDYDNHPIYNNRRNTDKLKASKRQSPVRLFTNIKPSKITLPKEEGYRFCHSCDRYVARENIHCYKCNNCPSKDGRTYIHCDECKKCVKPGRVHCQICKMCLPKDHQCKTTGCYICGQYDHKHRNCSVKSRQPKRKYTAMFAT
ncbi:uncharacterized protein TRIADDRAFT_28284 [Trichoplax adhaerens]|uniref:GRF-type domain-containing protein n=1 Tax=Trichoplax adhaerens TaxID=10228 RepID=B3S3K0_TRIAD|nr:hypothetical protein TRIADDRAFT_28284 [Trichoplax adhaerens]EDV22977.1 hypothetical protein TRIADDRAFT_28284 [Trichoplax adhaerens]|eukprot:XP_002114843.1 hypothetical protein TRIADDRAFT_28284 [Trichoplax adhaerens]